MGGFEKMARYGMKCINDANNALPTMPLKPNPQAQRRAARRECSRQIVKKIPFPILPFIKPSYL